MWKYANAQWAFYPNGGGISTRGAVTPAWFLTAPFIRLTLMPVTQSSGNSYLFLERVSRVMASLLRKFLFLVVVLTTLSS